MEGFGASVNAGTGEVMEEMVPLKPVSRGDVSSNHPAAKCPSFPKAKDHGKGNDLWFFLAAITRADPREFGQGDRAVVDAVSAEAAETFARAAVNRRRNSACMMC